MGRALFIVSTIIIILSVALFAVGFFNLLPFAKTQYGDVNDSITVTPSQSTITVFDSFSMTYWDIYNELRVVIAFTTDNDTTLKFQLYVEENTGAAGVIGEKTVEVVSDNLQQISFSIYAWDILPSIISPSLKIGGDAINVDLLVTKEDGGSVGLSYQVSGNLYWKIMMPVGMILFVVGIVTVILAFIVNSRSSKAGKPLKYQSALFEPQLSGSSQQSRFGVSKQKSKVKSKTKTQKATKTKPVKGLKASSSANRCKQCSKPVPRQAQYCPHCYARQ